MTTPDIRSWLDRFGSGQLLLGAMARPHTHIFCYYIHIKSICVASGYYSKQSQKYYCRYIIHSGSDVKSGSATAEEAAIAAHDLMG